MHDIQIKGEEVKRYLCAFKDGNGNLRFMTNIDMLEEHIGLAELMKIAVENTAKIGGVTERAQ